MHIVKPIHDVEKRKCDGKEHSGPLVDGIHISQVGDFDFELRCTSADAALVMCSMPV